MRKTHCRKDGWLSARARGRAYFACLSHPKSQPSLLHAGAAPVVLGRGSRLVGLMDGMDGSLMSHWANLLAASAPPSPSLPPFGVRKKNQGRRESRPAFGIAPRPRPSLTSATTLLCFGWLREINKLECFNSGQYGYVAPRKRRVIYSHTYGEQPTDQCERYRTSSLPLTRSRDSPLRRQFLKAYLLLRD